MCVWRMVLHVLLLNDFALKNFALIKQTFKFVGEGIVAKCEYTLSVILLLRTLNDREFTSLANDLWEMDSSYYVWRGEVNVLPFEIAILGKLNLKSTGFVRKRTNK